MRFQPDRVVQIVTTQWRQSEWLNNKIYRWSVDIVWLVSHRCLVHVKHDAGRDIHDEEGHCFLDHWIIIKTDSCFNPVWANHKVFKSFHSDSSRRLIESQEVLVNSRVSCDLNRACTTICQTVLISVSLRDRVRNLFENPVYFILLDRSIDISDWEIIKNAVVAWIDHVNFVSEVWGDYNSVSLSVVSRMLQGKGDLHWVLAM